VIGTKDCFLVPFLAVLFTVIVIFDLDASALSDLLSSTGLSIRSNTDFPIRSLCKLATFLVNLIGAATGWIVAIEAGPLAIATLPLMALPPGLLAVAGWTLLLATTVIPAGSMEMVRLMFTPSKILIFHYLETCQA